MEIRGFRINLPEQSDSNPIDINHDGLQLRVSHSNSGNIRVQGPGVGTLELGENRPVTLQSREYLNRDGALFINGTCVYTTDGSATSSNQLPKPSGIESRYPGVTFRGFVDP